MSQALPNSSQAERAGVYSRFETELQVRPDDIDMYQHVHSSRYMDYVLAARFDQMARCYKMSMREFHQRGLGWFMASAQMDFRRPLVLGSSFVVRTWVIKFTAVSVQVGFEIVSKAESSAIHCAGVFDYVLISLETGKPTRLPADVRAKYGI